MLKRITAPLVLLALLYSGATSQAQVGDGPTSEQQQMFQQMQDMRAKIMDNMQKQGIDPREFFQGIQQKMQDGSFDFNDLQAELVDKGLIDQQSIDDMQATVQKVTQHSIKDQLGLTDDEWTVVLPKIQAVLTAQAALAQPGGGGGMGGMMAFSTGSNSDVSKARRALHIVARDPSATPQIVNEKLSTYREARAAARVTLAAAQKELQVLLTPRQEAILVRLGLLE